jgi:hypothetical protein
MREQLSDSRDSLMTGLFVKHDLHASFRRQMRANQELAIAELRNSSAVRQQSDRERAITLGVVPANAGTHNHRRLWLQKVSDTNVSSISRGVFRRDDASGFRTTANMASRSRGWKRPRFALNFLTLSFTRAQGMPDARRVRSRVRSVVTHA